MNIELKIKPLSVNELFKGRRFRTDKYDQYERDILFLLPKWNKPIPDMIRCELFYGFSTNSADIDNPTKAILDILQKKYNFNDKNIWEVNLKKCIVPKGEEFISIGIYPYLPI